MTPTILLPAEAASLKVNNGNGHAPNGNGYKSNGHKKPQPAKPADFMPPYDTDAEEALLAAVLTTPTLLDREAVPVDENDFWYIAHWMLFQAMQKVHKSGLFMTTANIRKTLPEDFKMLVDDDGLVGFLRRNWKTVDTSRYEAMIATLKQFAMQRKVLALASDLGMLGYRGGANLGERAQTLVKHTLADTTPTHDKIVTFEESVSQLYNMLEQGQRGIPTGLADLDKVLQGLKPGRVCIVAGRPGSGKSSLCFQVALNAEQEGYQVGIMSMEMLSAEMAQRAFAMEMGIDTNQQERMKPGDALWGQFLEWVKTSARNIWFDESTLQTPSRIAAVARTYHRQGKLDLLIIDYLQLMDGDKQGKNRNEELTAITRELANLAKELNIHILAACQMNRQIEYSDRQPRLADLRDSGSIEADAYQVMVLHPKNKEEAQDALNAHLDTGIEVDAVIIKNRNGAKKTVPLLFQRRRTRFVLPHVKHANLEEVA